MAGFMARSPPIAQPAPTSGAKVQGEDRHVDRGLGDEPVDRDRAGLADAVGAIGGLVFDGRVPPGVEVDHVVGAGEVEAGAAGFQRDQEHVAVAGLEQIHLLASLGGGRSAVEEAVGDVGGSERLADELEVRANWLNMSAR